MKHRIREELPSVIGFIALIWAAFLFNYAVPFDLNRFGVTPRTLAGLAGIPSMPFLHGSWNHLLSNTVPLFVLLTLLAGSRARSWASVVAIVLLGGLLLWLFGRPAIHVGASGLVFGLIVFLIVSGLLEGRLVPLMVSVIVGFLYGGTLFSGVIPRMGSQVSWDGHLFSAIAGGLVAIVFARADRKGGSLGLLTDKA